MVALRHGVAWAVARAVPRRERMWRRWRVTAVFEGLVARNYRALEERDLAAMMRWWADDAVFVFPGRTTISGTFSGKAAIEAWWRRVLDRMIVFHFTPKHVAFASPFGLTWSNTVLIEQTVDAATVDGLSAHVELVSVLRYRHGKVVHARDYFFDMSEEERIWGIRSEPSQEQPAQVPAAV